MSFVRRSISYIWFFFSVLFLSGRERPKDIPKSSSTARRIDNFDLDYYGYRGDGAYVRIRSVPGSIPTLLYCTGSPVTFDEKTNPVFTRFFLARVLV